MVGKNNNIKMIQTNLKKHYKAYKVGKRWLYASLASFALGAGLLLGGNATAYADTVAQNDATPVESTNVASTKSSSAASSTDTNKVSLQTANKTTDNTDTAAKSVADSNLSTTPKAATTNDGQTAKVQTPNTKVKVPNTEVQAPAPQTKVQASKAAPTTDAVTKSTPATQTPTTQTSVDPTNAQLKAAQASATQVYAATKQPQEIDAVAPEPGQTADATLTLSTDKIGYNSGTTSPFTATLKIAGKAGDKYVINLPAPTHVFSYDASKEQPLPAAAGTTTTIQNADKSYTITDTFNTTASVTQVFTFNVNNNALATFGPMEDVGKTVTKAITWSENDVQQTPVTFTQTITPTVNLSPVVQTYPNATNVPEILPNQNYAFSIKVNETNGVLDNGGPSDLVNRGDNIGGTTVTIPVPSDFKLDVDDTNAMNAFSDGQTISQPNGPGTDLVVTAPAGAGGENYQNDGLGYKFVGSFVMTQPATDTVYTASSPVSFNQVLSDGGTLAATGTPWSVKILGVNSGGTGIGNGVAKTNASGSLSNLLLDDDPTDDPSYLSSYNFSVDSAGDTAGAKIQINIADGLNATSIQTPSAGITPKLYLPGTTSYDYTLTLADGSTQTGTVNAGEKITSNSAIRTAVFTPNYLAPGANDLKGGSPDYKSAVPTTGTFEKFIVGGNLSATYDDGSAVKADDKLVSSSGLIFANQTTPDATTISSITQTVVGAVAYGMGYVDQHSTTPGDQAAGDLRTQGGDYGQSSQKIFEPTYYFVVPTATSVSNVTGLPEAKISTFKADDGQTVVKVDYSGTGITVSTDEHEGKNGKVFLSNNPDALPGSYPYLMYIVSPTTQLQNETKVADPSYTEGNTNAFLMRSGSGNWNIVTASAFYNTTLAKGNSDADPVKTGTSDDQGDSTLTFYDNVVNTSLDAENTASNASVAINLPTDGDTNGSQYTFKLTGPVTVPTNYTTVSGSGAPITSTVLYSTQPQAVTTDTTPNTTGYVTADQVADWSTIRSIIVSINGIQPNTSTGRIAITGTTDDFNKQAGKIGHLQSIFYGNGAKASVNPTGDAAIKITGTSIIKTRYHYTDSNGDEKSIVLDDLSKTLNDNADTFTNDYPTKLTGFSAADQALIPTGYKLVTDATGTATPTIVDGTGDGAAEFGQVAQYYYDGDFVQYDLVGDVTTQVKYVDDDNKSVVVGTPKTISGTPGNSTKWDMGTVPTGYKLATDQSTTGIYTFKDDDNEPVQIHLNHVIKASTQTTNRTIKYVVDDSNYTGQVPETQTQKVAWKITTDEAIGQSVATAQSAYYQQVAPTILGYTAKPGQADQEGLKPIDTKNIPANETVTIHYTADGQTAKVEYVDENNGEAVVGTPTTLTGTTNGTANWTTSDKPVGYQLAAGQAANGSYTFTTADNQVVKIKLAHVIKASTQTTSRTIKYVVDDPNYTGQVPETQTQKVAWKITTDEATGQSVATAQNAYYQQIAPTILGYTAKPGQADQEGLKPVDAKDIPANETVTIHYTADGQTVKVEYVDEDNGEAVVGTPTALTGTTNGTANWTTSDKPVGYQLAAGQAANGSYTFTTADNQVVKIKLAHVIKASTQTTSRTIKYVVDDPNYTGQVPETQTQKVAWKITTDEATGQSVATAQNAYYQQIAPTILGYTAKPGQADQEGLKPVDAKNIPTNETVTIHYTADAQQAAVKYVDDDNDGVAVGTPIELKGTTEQAVTWKANNIPTNYVLANSQPATGTYTLTAEPNQVITIHLVHQLVPGTATTTRTITYVIANGDKSKTPSPKIQTMNWKTVTDKVTGASYAAPLNDYAAVSNPPVAGYTAHTPNNAVPELSAGPMLTSQLSQLNLNRTVIYTADKQTVSITYTNTKTGEPINTVIVTGNTDEPINVPGLRGYTIDKTGVPASFEPGVTQVNVPATPDDTGTTTAPDEPDTTVPPVTPQTPDNTPTPEVVDTPVTSTSEGTVVPSTDNTPQKGQDNDVTTDSTDRGQVIPDSTTTGETDETRVAQPQATVGYASATQKTVMPTSQASATDQTNDVKASQAKLPQTSEQNNQAATLSLLGLMTGMLSLFGLKRRKRDDD